MSRHIEAYLDGVALSSVGPFLIQAVHEDAPPLELLEGERPGRHGTNLLTRKRQLLKIALEVAIREIFDLSARSRHMEALAAWAQGNGAGRHWFQLSSRPERRLSVFCTGEPALGSVRDYTSAARVEFTAYIVPFWEDQNVTSWALTSGATGSATIILPGSAPTPLCISVKPKTAAMTSFSITAGGQTIALTDLSVATTSTLEIKRDALDNLSACSGSTMLLSKRSAASADDLMFLPGSVSVSYTANTAVDVTITARGRWR